MAITKHFNNIAKENFDAILALSGLKVFAQTFTSSQDNSLATEESYSVLDTDSANVFEPITQFSLRQKTGTDDTILFTCSKDFSDIKNFDRLIIMKPDGSDYVLFESIDFDRISNQIFSFSFELKVAVNNIIIT